MTKSVLIYDTIGPAARPHRLDEGASGGSEVHLVQLAEALARRGVRVTVATRQESFFGEHGVFYCPHKEAPKTDVVIGWRCSTLPPLDGVKKLIIHSTDAPGRHYDHLNVFLSRAKVPLVCVSHWHASLFPFATNKHVIDAMIYDEAFAERPPPRVPTGADDEVRTFVYASAVMKGLPHTLEVWTKVHGALGGNARLVVTTPGYDETPPEVVQAMRKFDVEWVDPMPPKQLNAFFRQAEGLFFVSDMPETYGVVASLAEIANCRTHILRMRGPSGLDDAISNHRLLTNDPNTFVRDFLFAYAEPEREEWYAPEVKDRRPDVLVDKWLELIS